MATSANGSTPAPWTVDVKEPVGGCNGDIAIMAGGKRVAVAYVRGGEELANAQVIAAAQDTLQALREVVGDCYHLEHLGDSVPICNFCSVAEGDPHEPECTMHFVLGAIAKAEGRS